MKSYPFMKSLLLLLLITPMAVSAQQLQSKELVLKNFSEIHVSSGIELIITQGTAESARIVADESLIDAIVVEQSDNSVTVGWKLIRSTKKRWLNRTAQVFISYRNLNILEARDGSSVKTENVLKTGILNIMVSSGANVNAGIDCPQLQLKTNSGASALLKGTAGKIELEASSSSRINALELMAENAEVTANSGADIKVNVNKELRTTASSGGKIWYKGSPALENSAGSKSGNVKPLL